MIFHGGNVFYNGSFQDLDVRVQDGLIQEIGNHIPPGTGETVKDIKTTYTKEQFSGEGIVVKRGKKNFRRVVIK